MNKIKIWGHMIPGVYWLFFWEEGRGDLRYRIVKGSKASWKRRGLRVLYNEEPTQGLDLPTKKMYTYSSSEKRNMTMLLIC